MQQSGVDLDDDESEANRLKRDEVLKRDQARLKEIGEQTDDLVKQMEVLKKIDEMNKEVIAVQKEQAKQRKYISREEDLEIKSLYEEEQKKFLKMQETLGDKIDGEIDMDLHGNFTFRPAPGKEVKEEGI